MGRRRDGQVDAYGDFIEGQPLEARGIIGQVPCKVLGGSTAT